MNATPPSADEALRQRLAAAQSRRSAARSAQDGAAQVLAAFDCAKAHFELDELPFALRLLREATELAGKGFHRELLPELLGMSGRTLQRMKRWDEVLDWYRRAAQAAAEQGLAAQQLRWLGKEATTSLDMQQETQGRALLEQAIASGRAMQAAGQDVAQPLCDLLLRAADLAADDQDKSDALWTEVEALLADLPPGNSHFRAALDRAGLLAQRDQPWLAQTYFEEALEIGRGIGIDEVARQNAALQYAALLRQRNEAVQAGSMLLANLPHFAGTRVRHEVLTAAVDALFAGRAWQDMKSACRLLRELRQDMAPGWRYDLEMLYSVACRGLGEFDEALNALAAALDLAQAWGNPEALTKVRGQTAIVLLDHGDWNASAELGEELWAEGVRDQLAARTLVQALIAGGKLDRAAAISDEFEQGGGEALALARLRAHLADAGRGDARAAWYAVGVAAARSAPVQAEALTRLIALTPPGSADRLEQTRHRLRLVDRARMRVSDVFSDASWNAAVEQAAQFPAWLDDFLEEAIAAGADATAVYELERFRAQTLVNLLAERQALWTMGEMRRGWFKAEATARSQRARYRFEALAARRAGWRERRAAALELERLRSQALSAEGLIHISAADQGLHFPQDLASLLGDTGLAADECLVFAHPLPDRLALWAFDALGNLQHHAVPGFGRAAVGAMGEGLRRIGHDEAAPDVSALLAQLDDLAAAPLAQWLAGLGARRVFLSPGTALAALPLDCCASLMEPAAPELVVLPSGAALGFIRAERRPLPRTLFLVMEEDRREASARIMQAPRGHLLLIVDPTRDLDFAPLEAALVADASAAKSVACLDRERLDAAELAAACGQTEVLHLVGHGRFDDASPYRSGIAIGPLTEPAAFWSNADIFSDVEAPAGRLAVLSGCETGQTRPNPVSEEVSLPAAFIAAGFSAVIGSRWAVDDLSTTLLLSDFHRRWNGGGISVAGALAASRRWLRDLDRETTTRMLAGLAHAAAQALPSRAADCRRLCEDALELLAQEGERPFADPFYWGAFFVAGDGAIRAMA